MDTEAIRQRFKPERIRLLLIGESPPAKGGFFYMDRQMTKYTMQAFKKAHGKNFKDVTEFLDYFKTCGCYLDDLSHIAVNGKDPLEREKILVGSLDALAQRIREANPSEVASVLKKIGPYVEMALEKSGSPAQLHPPLSFPGHGHQNKYIETLAQIVIKFKPF